MKKPDVLIVTYYWPPSGGAGVQRFLKFAKYLPECGFNPLILTVENPTYPILDKSLEEDVPGNLKVYRTRTYEPFGIYAWLKGKNKSEVTQPTMELKGGLGPRISGWIRANLFLPDARRGWTLTAKTKAVELIDKFSIPNVITTGPPHSTHLIGKYASRKTGARWVADFRDPWSEVYYNKLMPRSSWARAIDRHMEIGVLMNADEVVVISPSMAQSQKNIYDREYRVIPNGFDPDDYPSKEELRAMEAEKRQTAEEDRSNKERETGEDTPDESSTRRHRTRASSGVKRSSRHVRGYHEPTWTADRKAGWSDPDMPGKHHKPANPSRKKESEPARTTVYKQTEPGGSLLVRFIGSVREAALPDDFLQAIALLPSSLRSGLTVEFIGNTHPRLEEAIRELDLEDTVHLRGYIPHRRAVKAMMEADLLLLSISRTPGSELILTGKLFEYLGSGKPILFLGATHGDAAEIILENNQGVAIEHEDVKKIRNFLSAALRQPAGLSAYTPDEHNRKEHPYSRLSLTKKLAELLEEREEKTLSDYRTSGKKQDGKEKLEKQENEEKGRSGEE